MNILSSNEKNFIHLLRGQQGLFLGNEGIRDLFVESWSRQTVVLSERDE